MRKTIRTIDQAATREYLRDLPGLTAAGDEAARLGRQARKDGRRFMKAYERRALAMVYGLSAWSVIPHMQRERLVEIWTEANDKEVT